MKIFDKSTIATSVLCQFLLPKEPIWESCSLSNSLSFGHIKKSQQTKSDEYGGFEKKIQKKLHCTNRTDMPTYSATFHSASNPIIFQNNFLHTFNVIICCLCAEASRARLIIFTFSTILEELLLLLIFFFS